MNIYFSIAFMLASNYSTNPKNSETCVFFTRHYSSRSYLFELGLLKPRFHASTKS